MSAPLRRSIRVPPAAGPSAVAASSTRTVTTVAIESKTHPQKRKKIEIEAQVDAVDTSPLTKTKTKTKAKPGRVPKAKVGGALHPADYPERVKTEWKVGAHVSAAGGVENAILNAASIGANSFALFVKSQRKWTSSALTLGSIEAFRARLDEFNYTPDLVLPHGSYLINLGNPDTEKREKSYECFLDDLKRCELLGLTRYNFHPGSTVGAATKEESIAYIAACLNRAHKETSTVVTVIENMAGSGNVLGSKFEEIGQIIEQVIDKSRVGVCLDTCHMFAAGYDIRSKETYESTMSDFDRHVGLRYLRGMHLNDSKTVLASAKDRHDNIGRGYISLTAFSYIMCDPRLQHIPLILETPTNEDSSVWAKEIEVLNGLSTTPLTDAETAARLKEVIRKAVGKPENKKEKGEMKKKAKRGKRKREDTDQEETGHDHCDEDT